MLFYSFQGNYEGIQAISTSSWEIQIEMRCLLLPWNLNVEQSQLIFNYEEDQLVTTYVGGTSLQDLTSNQFTKQMRIFQQRLVLPYQSIIDYNIGVVVFLDNDFINVVNYYSFELIKFIQFVSNLSKIKADLKYDQSSYNLYVTSSGNNMVQHTVVNLKTMSVAQYNASLNLQSSCISQEYFPERNVVMCFSFSSITLYDIDLAQQQLTVKVSQNLNDFTVIKAQDQDVLLLLNGFGQQTTVAKYNSTTLELIDKQFITVRGITNMYLLSQQKLVIILTTFNPAFIFDINAQQSIITCYFYDSQSQLIFFGYLQGDILYGSYNDLSKYNLIKSNLQLLQIYFNAPSQLVYAQQQVTADQPDEIIMLKINQQQEFDYQYQVLFQMEINSMFQHSLIFASSRLNILKYLSNQLQLKEKIVLVLLIMDLTLIQV
ncbi:hypothetical protein TTHERM_00740570 (macronuclear) [Tetrahymena thermophila SB210]|uniref:Uncharacterized protein n=1 Tax=Tetrahymena thermophila (strain SB210) TaxID=312017 RepID=Q239X5_TETTS|nr:hypothetical protein TTHERM_00740570 [Tetrahymena thermophila SB210]EAR93283.2 hypothetical protein TTHERM_00740570 [Tetrahymena thermophila SB210]|eukprot:XP_001013528.2 hypothetical protein TTHERM_00740570 [Tetrahymena thermophila SB210]